MFCLQRPKIKSLLLHLNISILILSPLSDYIPWRPRCIEFKFLGPECLADHILNTSVKQFYPALRKKCGQRFLHFIFWVSLAAK